MGDAAATGELGNANYLILPKVQGFQVLSLRQAVTEF